MAQRVEIFDVEAPAGTLVGTPLEVACGFDPGLVEKVWVVIPDGHAGLTGIILAVAHEPVIPFNRRATPASPWRFIEGNDESIAFDLENYPDSGAWTAFVYNADVVAHQWQLRFEVNELTRIPNLSVPSPITLPSPPVSRETPPPAEPPPAGEGEPGEGAPGEGPTPEAPEPEAPPEPAAPEEPPEAPTLPEAPAEDGEIEAPPEPGEPATTEPGEAEGAEVDPTTGGTPAPGSKGVKAKPPHKGKRPPGAKTVERVTHTVLPAGGWLPHGARYDSRRNDQGHDGITAWHGPITAPGDWECLHVLSDRPFPNGFGHAYCVLRITTGRFAGHDWYVGHCTTAVHAGQKGHQGAVVAHADQGHVEGGGWFEIGEAPGGTPGPMGNGARFAHLFSNVTITHRSKTPAPSGGRKAPPHGHKPPPGHHPAPGHRKPGAPPTKHSGGTKAPPAGHRPPPGHKAPSPPKRKAPPPPPAHHAPPPPPAHHAPPPPPPPPRRPPPPPPPPPRRAPPPPPPPRKRR